MIYTIKQFLNYKKEYFMGCMKRTHLKLIKVLYYIILIVNMRYIWNKMLWSTKYEPMVMTVKVFIIK